MGRRCGVGHLRSCQVRALMLGRLRLRQEGAEELRSCAGRSGAGPGARRLGLEAAKLVVISISEAHTRVHGDR